MAPSVRVPNARPLGERLLTYSYVSYKRLEYPGFDFLTGNHYWAGTTLRYALDPTSAVWTSVCLKRYLARDEPSSYRAVEAVPGHAKESPARFNIQAEVSVNRSVYDQPAPLFGEDRRDRPLPSDLLFSARDWTFRGFAPTLTLSVGRNNSTIPLHSYTGRFVAIGLIREFQVGSQSGDTDLCLFYNNLVKSRR